MNAVLRSMAAAVALTLTACAGQSPPSSEKPAAAASVQGAQRGVALQPFITQPVGRDNVEALAFSPDGKRIAVGAADGFIAIYSLEAPDEEPIFARLHTSFVSGLAWSPSGQQLLTAATDSTVRLATANLAVQHSFPAVANTYPAVAWDPDGSRFAVARGRDVVETYSADGAEVVDTFDLSGATTRAIIWLPGGDIVVGDDAGRVNFLRPGQAKPVRSLLPSPAHKAVNSLSLSPDGRELAVAYDDGTVGILGAASGQYLRDLTRGRQTGNVAWSPNGELLAVSSVAFDLTVFDKQGKVMAREDIGYDVNGVTWSADGQYVAAGTDAHDFRIWRLSPPQRPSQAPPLAPGFMGR